MRKSRVSKRLRFFRCCFVGLVTGVVEVSHAQMKDCGIATAPDGTLRLFTENLSSLLLLAMSPHE